MDKAYIDRKIENCKRLIGSASCQEQKKIYQGYLDFWIEKLPKKAAVVEIVIDENTGATELFDEPSLADIFELENAPKQAYYNRNGKTNKTKAFKEYLNQRTQ